MKLADRLRSALDYLRHDAEVGRIIKEDMTDAECRRVVKRLARQAIARRAKLIHQTTGCKPKAALRRAVAEYKAQMGGFR